MLGMRRVPASDLYIERIYSACPDPHQNLTFGGNGPFDRGAPEWCVCMVENEDLHSESHLPASSADIPVTAGTVASRLRESSKGGQ